MKKKAIAIIIIVLCVSILLSGCIDEFIGSTHISYQASLLPVNGTAIVYLPIAINRDGSVSDVMNNLTICYPNGTFNPNVIYEIIDTKHGKALKIVTNKQIEVRNHINRKGAINQNFSMWNGMLPPEGYYAVPAGSVWIYLDNSSMAEKVSILHLEVDSSCGILFGHAGLKISINHPIGNITVLKYGWDKYPVYKMRY